MTEIFYIDYPKNDAGKKQWNKRFGLNAYYAGKHWKERSEDADYWHMLVKAAMHRQNVRRRPFEKPVCITMLFNDRLDCSNHAVMFKLIEDAMKGWIITDDSRKFVRGNAIYFHDAPYIKVIVTEIEHEKI